jgi:hypothetical protein
MPETNKIKVDYYIIYDSTSLILPLSNGRQLVVPQENFLFELINKKGGLNNGSRKSQRRS